VAATINAEPIVEYKGGVFTDDQYAQDSNHIVSIVGWGTDDDTGVEYWIIRNSWGQYWGEMGYMRLATGKNLLGIEGEVAWATPGSFTVHNFPCSEDGKNCASKTMYNAVSTHFYQDPSKDLMTVQRRLVTDKRRALRA
jgi:cathepsin X